MKKIIKMFLIIAVICSFASVTAYAANPHIKYSLTFPTTPIGSAQWSGQNVAYTANPYFVQDGNCLMTNILYTNGTGSTTPLTNTIQITTAGSHSLSYYSGYLGKAVALCGYPDSSIFPWSSYTIAGVFYF